MQPRRLFAHRLARVISNAQRLRIRQLVGTILMERDNVINVKALIQQLAAYSAAPQLARGYDTLVERIEAAL